jgi:hypothetical protein
MDVREMRYCDLEIVRPLLNVTLREFVAWRAYTDDYDAFRIIVDDFKNRKAIVFTYEKSADRDADAELILQMPDEGDGPAAVPAWLIPRHPRPAESCEEPITARFAA